MDGVGPTFVANTELILLGNDRKRFYTVARGILSHCSCRMVASSLCDAALGKHFMTLTSFSCKQTVVNFPWCKSLTKFEHESHSHKIHRPKWTTKQSVLIQESVPILSKTAMFLTWKKCYDKPLLLSVK